MFILKSEDLRQKTILIKREQSTSLLNGLTFFTGFRDSDSPVEADRRYHRVYRR